MGSPGRPVGRRHRAVIITPQALEILENALSQWWYEKESKTKKLTREQQALKLDLNPDTWDKIRARRGVDKVSLQHAFAQLNLPWKDEYCVQTHSGETGSVPLLPALMLGREQALRDLKDRLIVGSSGTSSEGLSGRTQVLTAMRGWPGVGKTTLAAFLAHDAEILAAFPDGVLWTTLGTEPDVLSLLTSWGYRLQLDAIGKARTVEEASALLAAALQQKRMLLIVDDVWRPEQAIPFRVGGAGCALLLTTRESRIAHALVSRAEDVYVLPVLTETDALQLLQTLAPSAVARHKAACRELCRVLEGLPLALQVAGRLLHSEESTGFDVQELLIALNAGARILEEAAPADLADLIRETTPTVAALLRKSTDRLDPVARDCFALLGPFAPKPATFDLAALKFVWEMADPRPIVRTLVERGLLEPLGKGRFQMHALLVTHACSLLKD